MPAVDQTSRRLWIYRQGLRNPATRGWAIGALRYMMRDRTVLRCLRAAAVRALREAGLKDAMTVDETEAIS